MRIYEDLRGPQRRAALVQAAVSVTVLLLLGSFWHLQVLRGRHYQRLAENNHLRSVRIAASRGAIFDRRGRILAENRSSFNVVLSTEHARDPEGSLAALALLLAVDGEALRGRLFPPAAPRPRAVLVKADAGEADVAVVDARRLEFPEAAVDVVPIRAYPLGSCAAHILGRVGEITERQLQMPAFAGLEPGTIVGQAGLEFQYNQLLSGRDGVRRAVVNSRGAEVEEGERVLPENGPAVTLTLDADLQALVEEELQGLTGSVAALDPATGEVLALASRPAYDPNLFSTGIEPAAWWTLVNDAETPLLNRAIQGQYAAGSTFKIVVALAALEEGVVTPATTFYCPGYLNVYGTVRRCNVSEGHGNIGLVRALALSCNVYFYQAGIRLEISRLAAWGRRLGLGAPTGLDLPAELGGLMPSPEWKLRVLGAPWFPGETVSVAIGQGQVLVTPLQMARLAAVVANGGDLVRPFLTASTQGRAEPVLRPQRVALGLRPESIAAVREGMVAVVREGTGQRAGVAGVAVAGKTGSSQVVTRERLERDPTSRALQPHGWFVGFAPVDGPRVALAVLVEHGRSGGTSAAPVAGRILARYLGRQAGPPSRLAAGSPASPPGPRGP
jgi:penicillin-binding protein 2